MPIERSPNRLKLEVGDKHGDNKHGHRLQDAPLLDNSLASNSKQEVKDISYTLDRKRNGKDEKTNHSNPTAVSRQSYQHDDRRIASRDGSLAGRRPTSERGWWKDSKDEVRAARRSAPSDPKVSEEKSRIQGDDNHVRRRNGFTEAEADAHPPSKKRRPFREERPPLGSKDVDNAVLEHSKVAHPPSSSTGGTGRWEQSTRDRRPLERNEHDQAYARERSFSNRGRGGNTGFSSRDRYNGVDSDGQFRGRENHGERQGYRSNGTRVEKWKHDLYDQANRSPPPKNEEDPVAKVEALLSL